MRKELARRGQGDSDTMKAKMAGAMAELDKHKNDQKDITAGKSIKVLCCESSFILSIMFLVIINTKKQVIPLKKVYLKCSMKTNSFSIEMCYNKLHVISFQ